MTEAHEDRPPGSTGFRGMMPIMPTAITADGRLDEASQRRVVRYCLDAGAVAIGHFGIASEFYKIPHDMRRRLINIIVDEVGGRVPVFFGVTSPAVAISLDYAREAEQLGGDLIMSSLPYVDPPTPDAAMPYFAALSDATTLPLIVQDTPQTSATLTADLICRMAAQIERIAHVKAEGAAFIAKTAELIRQGEGRLSVIGGAGGRHLIHLLRLGVTAFMTGTEALELHGRAVASFLAGDEAQAADIYYQQIVPYLQFYLDYPEELLKAMLHRRGIIDIPEILPPRASLPMSDVERQEFEWVLQRIGYGNAKPTP